jgi:hypothetical protein
MQRAPSVLLKSQKRGQITKLTNYPSNNKIINEQKKKNYLQKKISKKKNPKQTNKSPKKKFLFQFQNQNRNKNPKPKPKQSNKNKK